MIYVLYRVKLSSSFSEISMQTIYCCDAYSSCCMTHVCLLDIKIVFILMNIVYTQLCSTSLSFSCDKQSNIFTYVSETRTALEVIFTNCTCGWKSNYHMNTAMTAPYIYYWWCIFSLFIIYTDEHSIYSAMFHKSIFQLW
jgi:hypothetical protein